MIYQNTNGQLINTQDPKEINLQSFLQELQLFKGENPININAGMDFLGIFNYEKFFITEWTELSRKYSDKFKSLDLISTEIKDDKLIANILITHLDDSAVNETLEMSL